MKATVGDRVRIHGRAVGMAERTGEVVEIRGQDEHALLVVRFDEARVDSVAGIGLRDPARHVSDAAVLFGTG